MGQYTGNHPRWGMIRERELIHDAKHKIHEMDRSLKAYDKKGPHQEGKKALYQMDTKDTDQFKTGTKAGREIGLMTDGGPIDERATRKG
tara:strand:+ start:10215 stop:10481 length:267 start_codon:yes stop_codon:yes gene_type:complete